MVKTDNFYQVVADVINHWDPAGLLAIGAPADEYEMEVAAIYDFAESVQDVSSLAELIRDMFDIHMDLVLSQDRCMEAAEIIMDRLLPLRV